MSLHFPPRLRRGDMIRVIAPALSRAVVNEHDHSAVIERHLDALGLQVSFGAHVDTRDHFDSAPVAARVEDLHAAFTDPAVAGVLTAIGGFNSAELLPYIDWELIAAHPKVFCGYSDITALQGAMLARSGLVTYSGPHWSTFGMRDLGEQTVRWFEQAVFDSVPIELHPSPIWTDDAWFLDQDTREVLQNDGWWAIQPGRASGRIVGGNLCTLGLLQGTEFMPDLDGSLLAVEDDAGSDAREFARNLTSLLQLPEAAGVTGLLVGRFQRASGMSRSMLEQIVSRQPVLRDRPVLANADFGHTSPLVTLPIGGVAELVVADASALTITRH